MKKYIFIDRDGVINKDGEGHTKYGYVTRWEEFEFIPGVLEAFKEAREHGYKCVVVSNQQCVGKGYCSERDLDELTLNIRRAVAENGGDIEAVYYCTHLKEEDCSCRKPRTGLFEKAAKDLGLDDIKGKYYIGDTERDVIAGKNSGLKTILVLSGKTKNGQEKEWEVSPDKVCADLREAVKTIIASGDD